MVAVWPARSGSTCWAGYDRTGIPALAQPIIWLAVAALVYGSQMLSLAELCGKCEPYLAKVPGSTVFASHADRRRARGTQPPAIYLCWLTSYAVNGLTAYGRYQQLPPVPLATPD